MSKSAKDSAPAADLARTLLNATRAFETEMLTRLAGAGIDLLAMRHFPVLRGLDPGRGARAATLARDAGISRQAIAQVVAELEKFGFVEQVPDPTDARAKLLRYTPSGLDGYHRAMQIFTELEREATEAIGERRTAALKQDLRKLASLGSTPARHDNLQSMTESSAQQAESPAELIDARIKELDDWRGRTLARLRALIKAADPDVIEEWKWKKATNPGVPVWSHQGMICTGETYKSVVKLTFFKGASLEDPSGLFNSSLDGNTRRAIDFREDDDIDEQAFVTLIRAAVSVNDSSSR